jgi:hypothetical protein
MDGFGLDVDQPRATTRGQVVFGTATAGHTGHMRGATVSAIMGPQLGFAVTVIANNLNFK